MKNTKEQDKLFQSYIEDEKLGGTRIMGVLGSMLYIVFAIVDFFSLSRTLEQVFLIRGAVVIVLLGVVVFSYTHVKILLKYHNIIFSMLFLIAAAGIEAMIYLTQPEDHASSVYFVGLLLIIMTIYAWSFFKTALSFVITFTIIATYTLIEIQKGISLDVLFVNIVFLVSGFIISFISQVIRDRYLKDNFLLQQSLKEAVEAKTLEAKDNAYLANHDPLTDLPNRRYVTELLEDSLEVAKQDDKILAILFLDLNGFKQVNDVYGHAVGDEVLKVVAKRLEFAVREGDSLSRLAGDEFLVGLLMEKEGLSEVNKMSAKFTAIISKSMNIDGMSIKIGVSMGIAAYPMHGDKINALINIADKKMYKTKKGVQNIVRDRQQGESEPVVIFPGNSRHR
ncbi:MAG: GGDEF domain-containing protein [Cocleimonas sp.]|nr:GGDEF domain-containing protein [Cocleimonas sp.]